MSRTLIRKAILEKIKRREAERDFMHRALENSICPKCGSDLDCYDICPATAVRLFRCTNCNREFESL